jgi:CCR4-NOT transcription complex subunit 1
MLSVIADQLRYPSAHTLFFIHLILYLFSLEPPSHIPERVCRVLLERVLAAKPHPWGLVICFIELLDNEAYGLWKRDFVRSEEEIFRMFRNAHREITMNGTGLGGRGGVIGSGIVPGAMGQMGVVGGPTMGIIGQ